MLNCLEPYWNLVYYGLFSLEKKTTVVFTKVMGRVFYPLTVIVNAISKTKMTFKERETLIIESQASPKAGVNIYKANIYIGAMLANVPFGMLIFIDAIGGWGFIKLLKRDSPYLWVTLIIQVALVVWLNNQLIWNDDKYLKYFKKFDKLPKQRRRLSMLLAILTAIVLLCFSASSIFFMGWRYRPEKSGIDIKLCLYLLLVVFLGSLLIRFIYKKIYPEGYK